MKIPPLPHDWNVTPKEAVVIQREMAARVKTEKPSKSIRYVAGVDAAFPNEETCLAGVVVWDLKEKRVVEQVTAVQPATFPYIPGFLSFREAPTILAALAKLQSEPDLVMCDGQGIAHPRKLGIASHVGVIIDRPTMGCAKSILVGRHDELGILRGSQTPLMYKHEIIGMVVRTRDNVKPVCVSPGHKMDLESSVKLVLDCFDGYRLPEPTQLADRLVADERKKIF